MDLLRLHLQLFYQHCVWLVYEIVFPLATEIFGHFLAFGDATVDYIASLVTIFDDFQLEDDDVYFSRLTGKKNTIIWAIVINWVVLLETYIFNANFFVKN